jgi:hypothetical protein
MHRISFCLASLLSLAALSSPAASYELRVEKGVNVWSPSPLPPSPAFIASAPLILVQVNVALDTDEDYAPILYAHDEGYPGYVGGHLQGKPY